MAHLDLSLTKKITENLSIGAIGGVLYQIEDDDSDFADAHDGFKGRSVAIGPLVSYKAKFGENTEIDFTFKWSHELDVKKPHEGRRARLPAQREVLVLSKSGAHGRPPPPSS